MDYSKIISKSFSYVRSQRYLWWLGVLAALTEGGYGRIYQFNPGGFDFNNLIEKSKSSPVGGNVLGVSTTWLNNDMALILTLALLFLAVIIAIVYISLSARAGLITSIDRLENNVSGKWGFGEAFHSGQRFVGKLFVLGICCFAIIALILLIFTVPIVVLFAAQTTALTIAAVTLLCLGLLVLFVAAIYVSLVYPFLERKMVLENCSLVYAVTAVNYQLKKQFVTIFLSYLVNVGLSIAYGIAVAVISMVVGGGLFGIGYLIYHLNQTAMILYAVVFGLAFCFGMLFIAGIFTAFVSGYWTLAYRNIFGGTKLE